MPNHPLVIYDDRFLAHGYDWHPENRRRLEAITARLKEAGMWRWLSELPFEAALEGQIAWLHSEEYIEEVRAVCAAGGGDLASDTHVTPESYQTALLAAGGCIAAIEAITVGVAPSALCLVRPPGHHARHDLGGGFCIFNNVALAAEAALRSGLHRVAIVDFDVHHGHGTQEMFYHRGDVMYMSLHEATLYPLTGGLDEIGVDDGLGSTVNMPLPEGAGDQHYTELFARVVMPGLRKYRPELLLVSAGYDAHHADPLGHMNLTANGFYDLTAQLCGAAQELCGGNIAFVLEGGYNTEALCASVENTARAMIGFTRLEDEDLAPQLHPRVTERVEIAVRNIIEVHGERLQL